MVYSATWTGRTLKSKGEKPCALPVLVLAVLMLSSGLCLGDSNDIAVDTRGTATASASTTVTISNYVVNNNPNRLLVANIASSDGRWVVSSVVFNSSEGFTSKLSAVGPGYDPATGGAPSAETWALVAPSPTTADVIATMVCCGSCTCPSGSEPDVSIGVQGFFNVSQTNPGLTGGTGSGDSATDPFDTPVQSTTGRPDHAYAHGIATQGTGGAVTLDAQFDNVWSVNTGAGSNNVVGSGGTRPGLDPIGGILYFDNTASGTKWVVTILEIKPAGPTAVSGTTFEAMPANDGTLLRWSTGVERSNLGFNIYREDNGVSSKVNPSLIGGSVFLVGPQTSLSQGRSYEWKDPRPAGPTTRYWLEAVDLNGRIDRFEPKVELASLAPALVETGSARASVLSEIGHSAPEVTRAVPGIPAAAVAAERAPDRMDLVSAFADDSALATQLDLASGQAVKLSVSREGWYRVTSAQLAAVGFNPKATRTLRLRSDGEEQAMVVTSDPKSQDFVLEFHGRPLDTPYTATRVYWLVEARTPGLRFERQARAGATTAPSPSFPFTVERKDRTIYFAALVSNGEASNFFGPVVSQTPLEQTVVISKLDSTAPGDWPLEVALQGVTNDIEHSVEVRVNGNVAGLVSFDGQDRGATTLMVPRGWLVEGSNVIGLTALGGSTDVSLVDSIRLTYPHRYEAESGVLKFVAPAGAGIRLAGADAATRIVDITDPSAGIELLVTQAPGSSIAEAVVPGGFGSASGERTLLAFGPARPLSPEQVKQDIPSNWRTARSRADLTIVTNAALASAARKLQGWRQSQGLSVQVIDVEDLYDEYSYGAKDPAAIRSYLAGSRSKYALLFGDATIDPRNYLGQGSWDLLPTKLVPATYLKTASDDWFVTDEKTRTVSIPIGRIAVRTEAEATAVVEKLIALDKARDSNPAWLQKVVHVADKDDPALEPYSFEEELAELDGLVPATFAKTTILAGTVGAGEARAGILAALNGGALLFTYAGHGSQNQWSKSNIFNLTDASSLTGAPTVPVMLPLNCLNGLFVDAYSDSLAERLQKQSGGAAAIWASSGLTESHGQAQMVKSFYREVFKSSGIRLGDAIQSAKAGVTDRDVKGTWILFGDPTMIVR